ncbi:MAG: sulfite exporter TauE/SafE family protein [Melioribacteraceae bacterium]|nr:sulfite exporter TauE/SafE family protein [Melioribacteraceae bacterium]
MSELNILLITAASVGFFHTLFGPDHYIPFIVMAKARKWSLIKTSWVTFLCGIGHVLGSIVLGFIGIAVGVAIGNIEAIESFRGDIAGWALASFGFVYLIWGIRKAIKNKPHTHFHDHSDGEVHTHEHMHRDEHTHVHEKDSNTNITPWILFTIFVFGPCEALIPILMYPAANVGTMGVIAVVAVFALTTILTMMSIVLTASFGLNFLPMGKLDRYSHSLAGAIILISGLSMTVLGL